MKYVISLRTFRVCLLSFGLVLTLLPLGLFAQLSTQFSAASYDQLARTAEQQDKLFILYFHADWVAPCQYLAENVWPDVAVAELLNRRFLIRQVDVDQNGDAALAQRFRVEHIPSLLIFSANGLLIERIETALEPGDFYRRLLELDVPAHHLNPIATIGSPKQKEEVKLAPQPSFRIRPQLSQAPAPPQAIAPAETAIGYQSPEPEPAAEVFQARTTEQYGWLVRQLFTRQAAAEATIEEWIGRTGVNAEVREQTKEGQTQYRVIFGPFRTVPRAEAALVRLQKIGRDLDMQAW